MSRWIGKWGRFSTVAVLMALGLEPGIRARGGDCYQEALALVCLCNRCTYVVVCGATISAPPQVSISLCTGTNTGLVVDDVLTGSTGRDNYSCSYLNACGPATAVGNCCGGARTTFSDWRTYTTCRPAGNVCRKGSTGM